MYSPGSVPIIYYPLAEVAAGGVVPPSPDVLLLMDGTDLMLMDGTSLLLMPQVTAENWLLMDNTDFLSMHGGDMLLMN